jgi:bla regulator protein BlaR1
MQTILYNISQVIGVAIIHSLWQGLFIYLILRLALSLLPQLSSKAKHNLGFIALISIAVWFVCTLQNEINAHTWVVLKTKGTGILPTAFGLPLHVTNDASFSTRYNYTIEGMLPYITILYIAGLIFNTGQLLWARKKINQIRQTMSIDVQMQLKVDRFVDMLDITDKVQFGLSKLVDAPCMMGYFKPVILLPFTLSTYLSAEEIEIIILHELAHIKRNDYIANLFQQATSVLLFFNPFAQLINRIINHERENACDDIVIESTQKPLVYAHALLKLEQTRQQEWRQLMLAATGKKYHLLNRIERIMKTKKPIGNARHILLAIALLTASITGLAWLNPTIANGKISFNKIKPAIITELFSDTTKKKKATTSTTHKVAATHKPTKTKHSMAYADGNRSYHEFDDAKLEELSAEMNKYGEAMNKYYNSGEFQRLSKEMEKKGQDIDAFYNRAEIKGLERKQEEIAKEFEKMSETASDGTSKWSERMGDLGRQVGDYYKTPEFKQLNEQLEKKYGIPHDRDYGEYRHDENYRKYQDELRERISPEEKDREAELKKLGTQMRERFRSPEYLQKRDAMRLMGDSMRKAFDNPEIKEEQAQLRKLGEQMRAMQNNPEIKRIQQQMREAGAKMRAYTHSPEFIKRRNAWRETMRDEQGYRYYFGDDRDDEKSEKPEKPEQPEKSEKPDTVKN